MKISNKITPTTVFLLLIKPNLTLPYGENVISNYLYVEQFSTTNLDIRIETSKYLREFYLHDLSLLFRQER